MTVFFLTRFVFDTRCDKPTRHEYRQKKEIGAQLRKNTFWETQIYLESHVFQPTIYKLTVTRELLLDTYMV